MDPLIGSLVGSIRRSRQDLLDRWGESTDSKQRAEALLLTGRAEDASYELPHLLQSSVEARLLAVRLLRSLHQWHKLPPVLEQLEREAPQDPEVRWEVHRHLILRDDLATLQDRLESLPAEQCSPLDHLMAARLRRLLFDREPARKICEDILASQPTPKEHARTLKELGHLLYDEQEFQAALQHFVSALEIEPLDAEAIVDVSHCFIRLGHTAQAIELLRLALEIAPLLERAHYLLGNGYTQADYAELESQRPEAFASGPDLHDLDRADLAFDEGRRREARQLWARLARRCPDLADVRLRLGSAAFSKGRHRAARSWFLAALRRCPEYGRAHNGVAKALEAERLAQRHDLADDEERFREAVPPDLPGVEAFVQNWPQLSERHRKRVALSLAPWSRFLPALIDSEATYYIKPLFRKLSECPGQELLQNRRITYDSRLWDDVRGCGGYRTITGIEDVERTVTGGYDTVLHELSHQVHALLPAHRQRQLDELYQRTSRRRAAGEDAFISRYAATNVWEYLAEGAHALSRPRRNPHDRRELVKERLEARDPALVNLIHSLQSGADVEACKVVGQVNRGDDLLRRGHLEEALGAYRLALQRDPGEERPWTSLLHALLARGDSEALERAREAQERHPSSGSVVLEAAEAIWLLGEGLPTAVEHLESRRDDVQAEDLALFDQQRSHLHWTLGEATEARRAAENLLEAHPGLAMGQWCLAQALALAGRPTEAWPYYEAAIQQRTGLASLRCAYARDLLLSGDPDRAAEQVAAARLLEPREPGVLAMEAWVSLDRGDLQAGLDGAQAALDEGPWCTLAWIQRARALESRGQGREARRSIAPILERLRSGARPEYVFRPTLGRFDLAYTFPQVERNLIARWDSASSG